ncbi:phosphorylcholine transferase LicD [Bacteroidia bacterium]|nr:phosphorylcholine transferase LicD [Bacteroidia bacterium]
MIHTDLQSAHIVLLDLLKNFASICQKHNLTYWLDSGTLLGAVRHQGFIPWDDDIDVAMPTADYLKFLSIAKKELPKNIFLQTKQTDPSVITKIVKLRNVNSLAIGYDDAFERPYHKGISLDIFEFIQYPKIPKWGIKFFCKMLQRTYSVLTRKHRLTLKTTLQYLVFSVERCIFTPLWKLCCRFKSDKYIGNVIEQNVYKIRHRNAYIFPVVPILFEGEYFSAPQDSDAYLKTLYGNYMQLPPEDHRVQHNIINITDIKD